MNIADDRRICDSKDPYDEKALVLYGREVNRGSGGKQWLTDSGFMTESCVS